MSSYSRQADARTVDGRGDHLSKGPELIEQLGLESQRDLTVGKHSAHGFTVLSVPPQKNSGNLCAEYIGTQLHARHPIASNVFDRGPPLGVKEGAVVKPIRDGLLLERRPLEERGDAFSQSGLTAGDFDGPPKSTNVRFIHALGIYKITCNSVNKCSCVTTDKAPCIVLPMARKSALQTPRRDDLRVGHDGRTATDRFAEAFADWTKKTGGTQQQLADQANRIMRYEENERGRLTQQEISQFLAGQNDLAQSSRASAIAEVIGVPAVWLQHGEGSKEGQRALSARQLQALKDLGVLPRSQ